MPDLAPILATKFDALRGVKAPGVRLFLFKEGTTAERKMMPIVFDPTKAAGEVRRGWIVKERRFDRFSDPFLEIQIARTKKYTAEVLAPVRGFALMRRGETVATIQRCNPAGMAELPTEPVWKFTSTGRTTERLDITPVGATLRLLESGAGRFLEDGTARRLEA